MSPRPRPRAESSQPTLSFVFPSLGQQTTCNELYIQWFYNGPTTQENDIALYITNEGLSPGPSGSAPASTSSGTGTGSGSGTSTGLPGTSTSQPGSTTATFTNPGGTTTEISHTRSGSDVFPNPPTTTIRDPTATGIFTNPEGGGIFTNPEGDGIFTNPVSVRAIPSGANLPPASSPSSSTTVAITSTEFPPYSGNFTWQRITVPPGLYVVAAAFPDSGYTYTQRSLPFTVTNGTDTSCVGSQPTTALPPSGSATAPPPPGDVGAVANSHTNKGAIAGGVVGALAALAALIGALLFYRYKQRKERTTVAPSSRPRRWNRLGQVDLLPAAFAGGGGNHGGGDRKPAVREYGTDVKSPTSFATDAAAAAAAPTSFVYAPPAAAPQHDPFADSNGLQQQQQRAGESASYFADEGMTFTPVEIGYGGYNQQQNHSGVSVAAATPADRRRSSPNAGYPSGVSDALPDEDLAAIWSSSSSPSSSSPAAQGSSPAATATPTPTKSAAARRKPVPSYSPGPSTIDDMDLPSSLEEEDLELEPELGHGTASPGKNMMGKEMHYLVPDAPPPPTSA